jgi:hypothetical protein
MSSTSTRIICRRCEHRNRAVARFCARCGDAIHDAPRVSGGGRTAGSRVVVGLVVIGVALASYGLFARVRPTRPLPMNLWNPPEMKALQEREESREPFMNRAHRDTASPSPGKNVTTLKERVEFRVESLDQEIVE